MRKPARMLLLAAMILAMTALMPLGAAAEKTTTIEFWTLSLSPFFDAQMKQLADDFEKANPGIKVKWVDVPYSAAQQKLLSAIAAGNPPDVVNLSSDMTIQLYQQGALAPLSDYAPAKAFSVYFPRALDTFTYDGKVYGTPWYWAPKVMAYNTEIFKKAGLDPNKPPKTIPEMIDAAKKIKDKTGMYGFMPNINGVNFLYLFQEAGLPILDKSGHKAVFNSPAHVKLLQSYIDLYKQDYMPEDTMRRGYIGATELYGAGKLGMLLTGPQFLIRVEKDNKQVYDVTRAAAYPLDKGEVIHTPLMGLSVPANARHKEEAVKFALFATNDANQLAFAKASNTFPSTIKAAEDPFFTTGGPTAADEARVADAKQLKYAKDLTVVVPDSSKLFKAFKDNIEAAFFGSKSAQEALDDTVKIWNASL